MIKKIKEHKVVQALEYISEVSHGGRGSVAVYVSVSYSKSAPMSGRL